MQLKDLVKMRPYKKQMMAINSPEEEELDEYGQPITPEPSAPEDPLDPAVLLKRKKTRAVLNGLKGSV